MIITAQVHEIVSVLASPGAVVAYPTETFYGLGSRIEDHEALERIIALKGRDAAKGIIVLVSSMEEASSLALMDSRQRDLLGRFWPGALSALLPARKGIHSLLAPEGKIAIRISPHPLAFQLTKLSGPITSTSANLSGMPASATAEEVRASGLTIDAILDGGRTQGGKPSTLIDLTVWPPACLREGVIAFESIAALV